MQYDRHLARAKRGIVRFYLGLRNVPDRLPFEPIIVVKPPEFVRAFLLANPIAWKYRSQLLQDAQGCLFIFAERRWKDRNRIGQHGYLSA